MSSLDDVLTRYRLTIDQLDIPCSKDACQSIAKKLSQWESLASYIGLSDDEDCTPIKKNYRDDFELQRVKCLTKWRKKLGNKATYLLLAEGLEKVDRLDLVGELCELFCKEQQKDTPTRGTEIVLTHKSKACLDETIESFEKRFKSLVKTTLKEIQRGRNVSELEDDLKVDLTLLPENIKYNHLTYIEECVPKIMTAPDLPKIIMHLDLYWDYFHYALLEVIINNHGSDGLKQQMKSYVSEMKRFCRETTVADFIPHCRNKRWLQTYSKEFVELKIKLNIDKQRSMDYTLIELEELKYRLYTMSCPLPTYALILYGLKEGCLEVTWLVAAEKEKYIKKMLPTDQLEGIMSISLRGEQICSDKLKERDIQKLQAEIVTKDHQIQRLQTEVGDRDGQLRLMQRETEAKDEQLQQRWRKSELKERYIQAEIITKDDQIQQLQIEVGDQLRQMLWETDIKDEQLQHWQRKLELKERDIQQLQAEIVTKDHQIQQLRTEVGDRDRQLRELQRMIAAQDQHLQRVAKDERLQQLKREKKEPLTLKLPLRLRWRRGPDMPLGKGGYVQSVRVKEKVYIGGEDDTWHTHENDYIVMEYDTLSEKWATLPPYRAHHFGMTNINNQLVLVGGYEKHSSIKLLGAWRAESKEWTHPYPEMPTAHSRCSAVTYNQWLVVAGGKLDHLSSVEIMDTINKQWYTGPPTPTEWISMKTATVGDMCYFMGGYTTFGDNKVYSVSLSALTSQLLNPKSATKGKGQIWKEVSGLQVSRATPLSINGSLLALGGWKNHELVTEIHLYQPETGEWVKVGDLLPQHYQCTSVMISDREILVAGWHNVTATGLKRTDIAVIE